MFNFVKNTFKNIKISTEILIQTVILVLLVSITYAVVNYVISAYADHPHDHRNRSQQPTRRTEFAARQVH